MTTGQRKWTPSVNAPVSNQVSLIPKGDYELVVDTSKAAIKKSENNPEAIPRVSFAFKVPEIQTATGGSRLVFHDLYLSLKPGKNGQVMPERIDGLYGLARAFGEEVPEFDIIDVQTVSGSTVESLNSKQVLSWLKEHDGASVRGHVRIEKGTGGYNDKNKISAFEEAGGQAEAVAEEYAEAEPEAEASADYADEADEAQFDPLPPKRIAPIKATKAAPPRVVQAQPAKRNGATKHAR